MKKFFVTLYFHHNISTILDSEVHKYFYFNYFLNALGSRRISHNLPKYFFVGALIFLMGMTPLLPDNSAFAKEDKINVAEKISALELLVQQLIERINLLESTLANMQRQLDIQPEPTKVEAYEKSEVISLPSGQWVTHSILCDEGDKAQGGGFNKLTNQKFFIRAGTNHMQGDNGWSVEIANSHPVKSSKITINYSMFLWNI